MNAPDLQRSIVRHHVTAIEAKHPLKIIGLLPRGSAVHVSEDNALDFLAEKRPGLSYFGLGQAEVDLSELVGRPVGIVLVSELSGQDAEDLPARVEPL